MTERSDLYHSSIVIFHSFVNLHSKRGYKMNKIAISALLLISFVILTGFNTDNAIVPQQDILSGGPPKDGIPAILKPKIVASDQAAYLQDSDVVIGVKIGSQTRAYPVKVLNWHEVVNDTIDGVPIAVTF